MIDTHCHLNSDFLYQNWQHHVQEAKKAGVKKILILGTDLESSHKALEISRQSDICFAGIAIHPTEVTSIIEKSLNPKTIFCNLQTLALSQLSALKTIGETGLDYYWIKDHPQKQNIIALQQELFIWHLQIAKDLNLPVSIHIRDSFSDTLDILEKHQPKTILHCFSGNQENLERALQNNYYISFAGNITYKQNTSLQSLVTLVPDHLLLLETDSPYLNPHRGKFPNTPANIQKTYQFVAQLKNTTLDKLIELVTDNSSRVFKL